MRTYRLGMSVGLSLTAVVALTAIAGDDGEEDVRQIQAALGLLESGNYAEAEQAAFELATDEDAPYCRAWLIVADARQHQRKYDKAIKAYKSFLESCGSTSLRHYTLRQIQHCRAATQKVRKAAAPSEKLGKADLKKLSAVEKETAIVVTEHFVVHASNEKLSQLVADNAEESLQRICHVILGGQQYSHTVDIYVWADSKTYAQHAEDAPDWSGGRSTLSHSNGTITRRIDLTQLDKDGNFSTVMIDRILPHEMCHLVLGEYFGDSPFPLFLSEGLAMLAECRIDNNRLILAGTALASDRKIPLISLMAAKRYDIKNPIIFYAESFSIMHYVHSRLTGEQFRDLLANIKSGSSFTDALQRALYMPLSGDFAEKLSLAWEDYAITHAQFLRALKAAETRPANSGK